MTQFRHLCTFENELAGGVEWQFATEHWLILQVSLGIGYVRTQETAAEISPGQVLIIPPQVRLGILASTLEQMRLNGIGIRLEVLSGVLSAGERHRLGNEFARQCSPFKMAPQDHLFAASFRKFWRPQPQMSARHRMSILSAFIEFVAPDIGIEVHDEPRPEASLKDRMNQFFNELPEAELMDLSPGRLAQQLNCCERHASRLFVEVFGRSIRDYVSGLRLELACRLLTESHRKIIDVAYESGHRSLTVFNLVFKRRYGITPSEWRTKSRQQLIIRKKNGHSKRQRLDNVSAW